MNPFAGQQLEVVCVIQPQKIYYSHMLNVVHKTKSVSRSKSVFTKPTLNLAESLIVLRQSLSSLSAARLFHQGNWRLIGTTLVCQYADVEPNFPSPFHIMCWSEQIEQFNSSHTAKPRKELYTDPCELIFADVAVTLKPCWSEIPRLSNQQPVENYQVGLNLDSLSQYYEELSEDGYSTQQPGNTEQLYSNSCMQASGQASGQTYMQASGQPYVQASGQTYRQASGQPYVQPSMPPQYLTQELGSFDRILAGKQEK